MSLPTFGFQAWNTDLRYISCICGTKLISNRKFFFFSQKTKKNAFSRILSTIFGSVISVKKNQEHDGTNCTDVKMVWTPPRMLCLHPICVPFQPVIAMTSFTAQLLSASTRVERLIEEVTDIFRLQKAPFPFSNSVITRFRMRTNDRSMGGMNMRFRDR